MPIDEIVPSASGFFIADAHCDALSEHHSDRRPLARPARPGHFDLDRAREARVALQIFAVFIDKEDHRETTFLQAVNLIDAFTTEETQPGSVLRPALWREDVDESPAHAGSAVAGVLSVEGGEVLQGSLAALRALYLLGVRCLGLTWNYANELADTALDERPDGGLQPFGREVVAEMGRLGMAVDVSHLSKRGFWEVADLVPGPFLASHSSAQALSAHARNLDDRQLAEIGRHRGFVGVNFCPEFLGTPSEVVSEVSLDTVARHLAHMALKAGPGSVGLGSDFDGISATPVGLEGVEKLPTLIPALERVGFSKGEIQGILGGNLVRCLSAILPPTPPLDAPGRLAAGLRFLHEPKAGDAS